jgi:hypothetical protein
MATLGAPAWPAGFDAHLAEHRDEEGASNAREDRRKVFEALDAPLP